MTSMTIVAIPARKLPHGFHENTVDSKRRHEGSRFELVKRSPRQKEMDRDTKKPIPHTG